MSNQPIRVLIVDDHRVVRHGLQSILEEYPDIQVIGEAANGIEALERDEELKPDIMLLDIRMPEMDGIQTITELQKRGSPTKILVLTTYGEDEYLFPALRAGAHGYLLKTVDDEELANAIRRVERGERLLEPSLVQKVMAGLASGMTTEATPHEPEPVEEGVDAAALEYRARFNRRHGEGSWERMAARYRNGATLAEIAESFQVSPQAVHGWLDRGGYGARRPMPENGEARQELSTREQEVLQLIATGASNQEIAEQLGVSINTVRVHISKIFEKLGIRSRAEAAAYLRRDQ